MATTISYGPSRVPGISGMPSRLRQLALPVQDRGERLVIRGLRHDGEEPSVGRDVEIRPCVGRLRIVPLHGALDSEEALRPTEGDRRRCPDRHGNEMEIARDIEELAAVAAPARKVAAAGRHADYLACHGERRDVNLVAP